ncbi:MAG: sugar ABC transporter permease [Clostridia bacterium]|nr:sugar ABC transporter permease [Clostridia bacterium]
MSKNNSRKIKQSVFIILMLTPAIVGFFVFYIYVNFKSVVMAFSFEKGGETFYGLDNFIRFFKEFTLPDTMFKDTILNTLKSFLSTIVIVYPVSLIMCYFIYKKIVGYRFFRCLFYIPAIIMPTVSAVLFKYIISMEGPIDVFLMRFFGRNVPDFLQDGSLAMGTIIFYSVYFSFGGNILYFGGAMNGISQEVIESATLDGCGWVRELISIVIPMIWPTFSTLLLTASVGIFTASGPVLLFTQGGFNTYTISYWIYEQMLENNNLEFASAVGLSCSVIGFPIVMLIKWGLNKIGDKVGA